MLSKHFAKKLMHPDDERTKNYNKAELYLEYLPVYMNVRNNPVLYRQVKNDPELKPALKFYGHVHIVLGLIAFALMTIGFFFGD